MEIHREKNCTKKLVRKDGTIFREYIENATAHGMVRIFTKQYSVLRRLFWLVVFLVAAAGCLYNCIDRIRFLASAPTSTTVTTTRVRPLEFPAVTICNLNFFTATSLEAVGLREVGEYALNIDPMDPPEEGGCEALVSSEPVAKEVVLEDLLSMKGSQSLSEFIPVCTFLGKPCDMENDFTFSSIGFGACYTFNGYSRIPGLETNETGSRQGLFLVLNINQSEYIASTLLDAGARVIIHRSSEPAQALDQGIIIPPGRVGFVGVKTERIVNEAEVDCVTNYDNSQLNFLGNKFSYSSAACLVDCQITAVADICDCYHVAQSLPPSNSSYTNIRNCTFSDICCIQNLLTSAMDCDCPSACVSTFYDSSTTYSSIPADYIREYFQYIFGDDLIVDRNIIGLSVYYQTLNVKTETTVFSYSLVALLSDIGGQLGLFLGISVISVLEFCTWLLDEGLDRLCCFRISRKKKEKKGNQLGDIENGIRNLVDSEKMESVLKVF